MDFISEYLNLELIPWQGLGGLLAENKATAQLGN